jgi:hypothetical protein
VPTPSSPTVRSIIDRLAKLVALDGPLIEQSIMRIEKSNPEFSFLFVKNSDEYVYYQWRTYAFTQGD